MRDELPPPLLRTDVMGMEDLKPGMELTGTVRNVIDFGAFVDIGVHQDGLVHEPAFGPVHQASQPGREGGGRGEGKGAGRGSEEKAHRPDHEGAEPINKKSTGPERCECVPGRYF